MTDNGTLMSQPLSYELDEDEQIKLPNLPKGNFTSTPQALAQLYIDGHEQMRQVYSYFFEFGMVFHFRIKGICVQQIDRPLLCSTNFIGH
jgi:hypothetical protein